MTQQNPLRDQQKRKNYAVLLALILFVATVFFVTIIRMKGS
jgi:hypothetical protein